MVINYNPAASDEEFEPDYTGTLSRLASGHGYTGSELDQWEAARAAVEWIDDADERDADLSDDPVRMYLREIGRVNLLTAQDERVLARAKELGDHLDAIEAHLEEQCEDVPRPADVVQECIRRLFAERGGTTQV